MWIDNGRVWTVIHGILIMMATKITLVLAGCATEPDANGHVDIPSTWKSIGNSAFRGYCSLETVSIPDSVMSIGGRAFKD